MVRGTPGTEDRCMTAQQPTAPRTLRRRSDSRVIGGVASGLGDYFNVDPLLIRIGFVGLMVFGGMGVVLYVAAWLLVPDETTDRSIVERVLGRVGLGSGVIATLLIVLGAIVFLNVLGNVAERSGGVPALAFAAVVIVLGAMILRRGESPATVADASADPAARGVVTPTERVVVRRERRPPSPLGWYAVGAMLVGLGLLALVANVSDADIRLGQYFGLALAVVGIGLVVGTWWGNARGLILLGLLILPFAFAANLVRAPIEGGFGTHRYGPSSAEELRGEYRLVGGQIYLDLTQVDGGTEAISIVASVAMGELVVLLPADAGAELDATVGGGRLRIDGEFQSGTGLEDRQVINGDGPQFILDLEAGLGEVQVETRESEGR
jgi:phage shock protein PspC (stress-responsive transcriptional regulator)